MQVACFFCEQYLPIEGTRQADLKRIGVFGFKQRTPAVRATLMVLATFGLGEVKTQKCELVHVSPDGKREPMTALDLNANGHELQSWLAIVMEMSYPVGPHQFEFRVNGKTAFVLPFKIEA